MKARQFNNQEMNLNLVKDVERLKIVSSRAVSFDEINRSIYLNTNMEKYNERVKEQKLLYFLFNLLDTSKSINSVLQAVVDNLPAGSRFPEEICARIVFNSIEYKTEDFVESIYSLISCFETAGGKKGKIEIYYRSELINKNIGPSFIESHLLIDGISKMLNNWLNRRETEQDLEKTLVYLETEIENRTQQLVTANEKLSEVNKDINDSINYANRIQRAILPPNDIINNLFNESFVLYKPKDIISGDFYWLHKTADKIFYACADCTGHGVPGALMSMVGHQLLDHIITGRNFIEPDEILEEVDLAIIKLFNKSPLSDHLRDGMAMSLCVIDVKEKRISFSGALNNAYMFNDSEIITLIADRRSIGGNEGCKGKKFTRTVKNYFSGDLVYMFTDGFADQFGGTKEKKLMRKNLLSLIDKNKHESMDVQNKIFESFFEKWKGNSFQVDDVTLLGIKL
jgi:serine phosphatase RsbU (regulator of sigma subunit)